MDIQINTIYLIDAKNLGSKQCRYKFETTGMLPDDQQSEKRRDVTRGEPWNRVRVAKNCGEPVALDNLKLVTCNGFRSQEGENQGKNNPLPINQEEGQGHRNQTRVALRSRWCLSLAL